MSRWKSIKLGELSEDTQKVYEVLNKESDLACVLIGASYLSELLASSIKVVFVKTSISEKILDPQQGVIGGFASRANLARCLGIIGKNVRQDLIKVAEIRNKFAHKHLALDFEDPDIRNDCDELQAWRALLLGEDEDLPTEATKEQTRLRARNQFNMSVVLLGSRIHVNALSKQQEMKT